MYLILTVCNIWAHYTLRYTSIYIYLLTQYMIRPCAILIPQLFKGTIIKTRMTIYLCSEAQNCLLRRARQKKVIWESSQKIQKKSYIVHK